MGLPLSVRVETAVAVLLHLTGQSQADLAPALGVSQAQISRRQQGTASWSLNDCDALAAYFGIDVLDLCAGPSRAAECLYHRLTNGAENAVQVPDSPSAGNADSSTA
ncbi:helix-turn-helix domain-containing protein [Streptomyces umbrinus]